MRKQLLLGACFVLAFSLGARECSAQADLEYNSCVAGNFSGCCNFSCLRTGTGINCYCDQACYDFGDCCPDIADINCAPAIIIPRSCVQANYSGCCTSETACTGTGTGISCYCDQACYDFGDCCLDIADINCSKGNATASTASSCVQANYSGCCIYGGCHGKGGTNFCTCDQYCYAVDYCCDDIEEIGCYPPEPGSILSCVGSGYQNCCTAEHEHCTATTFGAKKCYCDKVCHYYGDCCDDIEYVCPYNSTIPSCVGSGYQDCCTAEHVQCTAKNVGGTCYCDKVCHYHGDCCDDIEDVCPYVSAIPVVVVKARFIVVSSTVDGQHSGRLEVFYDGSWGTVCSHGWDFQDTIVACKEFGFASAEQYYIAGQTDPGTGPITISRVECTGSEFYLKDCNNQKPSNSCTHNDDIGVICSDKLALRLVSNLTTNLSSEGRVEVFHNNQWGTICDDYWNFDDAVVVCKQLGYPTALNYHTKAYFGPGTGPIWMDDVKCVGNETSIGQCQYRGWGIHNCAHHEDTGVSCQPVISVSSLSSASPKATLSWTTTLAIVLSYTVRLILVSSKNAVP